MIDYLRRLYAALNTNGRATLVVTFATCLVAGCVAGTSPLLR
jgi:hypothetical protein